MRNALFIAIVLLSGCSGSDQAPADGGLTGPRGEVGPQGIQGVQGPQGDPGPQGPAGAKGDVGPEGPKGVTGLTGAQGPQGLQGVTGSVGPAGATGPQGVQGASGLQGPMGAQGATGPTGPAGLMGIALKVYTVNNAAFGIPVAVSLAPINNGPAITSQMGVFTYKQNLPNVPDGLIILPTPTNIYWTAANCTGEAFVNYVVPVVQNYVFWNQSGYAVSPAPNQPGGTKTVKTMMSMSGACGAPDIGVTTSMTAVQPEGFVLQVQLTQPWLIQAQ